VAKAISSLDHLCNGRLTVGVALGPSTRLYPAYGLPEERRVARFVEGLQVMRALWTEPQVTFQGEFQRLEAVSMEPKPLQQPHPPLWFGARAPAALKRAAAFGAGWMGAGSSSTSDFLTEVEGMRAALAGQGRDPAGFTLSKRVYISIGRDRESALERMRPWIGAFYGNPQLADRWAVAGTVEQCLEGLRPLVAAGAQHLLLNPVDGVMEHLEAFAAEIAPQL
jgi:alkanesulfonate monooxygenase SsuD/methylene tetrahydromethanopterin reductase-like flavin-dependent oxidoreductase (luciferase family)